MSVKVAIYGGALTALMSVANGTTAAAQDPSWTGPYIGAHLGYGALNEIDASQTPANADTQPFIGAAIAGGFAPGQFSAGPEGPVFGLHIGYKKQLGSVVVAGLEADISGGMGGESETITNSFTANNVPTSNVTTYSADVEWLGTLRARLGILATPTVLAYVTGGLAFGEVDQSVLFFSNFNGAGYSGSRSDTEFGWTIGGGMEWAILPKVSLKAEYLYFNLGDPDTFQTDTFIGQCITPRRCVLNVDSDDVDGHIGRVGVSFKLN